MNLKLHELKTAAMFCTVDDSRQNIMGVRFISPERMVATDGRILVVIETELDNGKTEFQPFTLKTSVIARLPDGRDSISVMNNSGVAVIKIPALAVEFRFGDAFIDLDFPQYHQVLPEAGVSEPVTVNGAYMAKIERAAHLFSGGKRDPVVWSNGEYSPLEFFIGPMPNFYGILMPMRMDMLKTANSLAEKLRAENKAK